MTLMDKINNWPLLKQTIQQAEVQYAQQNKEFGETYAVGFEGWVSTYKFMEDAHRSYDDWCESICAEVFSQYLKDPSHLGCGEIVDGLYCLQCACRNYSICVFLDNMFEDAREFIANTVKHSQEV